mmetsp:Transcript_97960/g.157983  ORF Transcript_97960/g.157983 Transcript_97960/m.157983 type:complete len:209 (-) Transcript_97960:224-850(-)
MDRDLTLATIFPVRAATLRRTWRQALLMALTHTPRHELVGLIVETFLARSRRKDVRVGRPAVPDDVAVVLALLRALLRTFLWRFRFFSATPLTFSHALFLTDIVHRFTHNGQWACLLAHRLVRFHFLSPTPFLSRLTFCSAHAGFFGLATCAQTRCSQVLSGQRLAHHVLAFLHAFLLACVPTLAEVLLGTECDRTVACRCALPLTIT